jgi:hypothetical protein
VKDNKAGDIQVNDTAKPYLLNTPAQ